MHGKTNLDTYIRLKECIAEIYPQIEVKLISQDPMLKELGFVDYIPCEIELCGTDGQIEKLEDMAFQFETDAYNTADGCDPSENDPKYIVYRKYGWIADFLYNIRTKGECVY